MIQEANIPSAQANLVKSKGFPWCQRNASCSKEELKAFIDFCWKETGQVALVKNYRDVVQSCHISEHKDTAEKLKLKATGAPP